MVAALGTTPDSFVLELDHTECFELLGMVQVGRVVLSVGCMPFALPVRIALLDGDVVFAADRGSKVTSSVYGQVVSVEADNIDPVTRSRWSVLVTGIAQRVAEAAMIDWVGSEPQVWVSGPDPLVVRVPSTLISGRRLLSAALSDGARP